MKTSDRELVMAELSALDEDIDKFVEGLTNEKKPDTREYISAYEIYDLIEDCFKNNLPISLEEVQNTRGRLRFAGSESALDYMNATMQKNMSEAKTATPTKQEPVKTSPAAIIPQQTASTTPARGTAPLPPAKRQPPPLPPKPNKMPMAASQSPPKAEVNSGSDRNKSETKDKLNQLTSARNTLAKLSGEPLVSPQWSRKSPTIDSSDMSPRKLLGKTPNTFRAHYREGMLTEIKGRLDPLKDKAKDNQDLLKIVEKYEGIAKQCANEHKPTQLMEVLRNAEEKVNSALKVAQSKDTVPSVQKK